MNTSESQSPGGNNFSNGFNIDTPVNYEQKSLCVLLLDTSYSMQGKKLKTLQQGIETFQREISEDPTTSNRLEVAIITFDSAVNIVQQPALVSDFVMPQLSCNGSTSMGAAFDAAIDLVEARKSWYKTTGQPYYRPWIITMTDGEPTDIPNLNDTGNLIRQNVDRSNFFFFAIGVQDADMQKLERLSSPKMPPAKLEGLRFAEFFKWLSASMTQVVNSNEGDEISLPSPANWMEGFKIQ